MPGRFTPRRLLLGEQRGALGTGTMTDIDDFTTTPVAVVGGLHFRQVSVGRGYTCGLTTEDLAYCWGSNFAGALGDGTTRDHEVPEPVVGPI